MLIKILIILNIYRSDNEKEIKARLLKEKKLKEIYPESEGHRIFNSVNELNKNKEGIYE